MVRPAVVIRVALALAVCGISAAADRPVFRVDVPYPTRDKPQSKLWFARGTWWAWLPVRGGSSVWKRSGAGWERQTTLDAVLQNLPGQADVWANDDEVRAVLVEPDRLAVVGLRWDNAAGRYESAGPAAEFPTPEPPGKADGIETATITRDSRGRWWIAYNWRRDMWVRTSTDGRAWSEPLAVSHTKASDDDLCSIVALPDRVGVIWSDQAHDVVYFRWHADEAARAPTTTFMRPSRATAHFTWQPRIRWTPSANPNWCCVCALRTVDGTTFPTRYGPRSTTPAGRSRCWEGIRHA
jgi:hypothetical protein